MKNRKPTGEEVPIHQNYKSNAQYGITLIALIITIIILLILAVVTVKLIANQGIITKAEKATSDYIIAQEKEKIQLGYSEYKMAKYNGENPTKPTVDGADVGDLTNGAWNIVFRDTKNEYLLYEEDGKIKDVISEEKEKITIGYNEYTKAKEEEEQAEQNFTQDQKTLRDYFYLGRNTNDIPVEEQDNNTKIIFTDLNITITQNDVIYDQTAGVITVNFNYNNEKYVLTLSPYGDIQKLEAVAADGTKKVISKESSNITLQVDGAEVTDYSSGGWLITFKDTLNIYILNIDGTIEGPINKVPITESGEVDATAISANQDLYLEIAKIMGQNTSQNTDIGIGTDGKIVNLDLWRYSVDISLNGVLIEGAGSIQSGYIGDYTEDGRIEGSIPQAIYENNKIYNTISTVKAFKRHFSSSSDKFKIAPEIPKSVINCREMFSYCNNLTTAPKIPNGVTNCYLMFESCKSLTIAPAIPDSVTDCSYMFSGCTSLKGTITINSTPTSYTSMLRGCGSEENRITLTGNCSAEVLEAIRQTGNADYITVQK